MKYKYMTVYHFRDSNGMQGVGRALIETNKPLTSASTIMEAEESIRKERELSSAFLTNFIELEN